MDDIYVAVFVDDLSTPGRFAEAGPGLLLSGPRIASGFITIDPDGLETSLEENIFEDLMLHELGHVMG